MYIAGKIYICITLNITSKERQPFDLFKCSCASIKSETTKKLMCFFFRGMYAPLTEEFVKLLETAGERNVDISSCKVDLVKLKAVNAKNLFEVGAFLRDAVHSLNDQLNEKNLCIKGLLALRG